MKNIFATIFGLIGIASGSVSAPGTAAPNFKAKNQDGKEIELSALRGHPVLIYFYPKDETSGCTREACSFRDQYSQFKKLGAVIFGVSSQNAESHQTFKTKHKLPFDLLIDEDGAIAKLFGVGTVLGFHKRQSVLIDSNGKIVRFYSEVNPDTHTQEVLKDLEALPKVQTK